MIGLVFIRSSLDIFRYGLVYLSAQATSKLPPPLFTLGSPQPGMKTPPWAPAMPFAHLHHSTENNAQSLSVCLSLAPDREKPDYEEGSTSNSSLCASLCAVLAPSALCRTRFPTIPGSVRPRFSARCCC